MIIQYIIITYTSAVNVTVGDKKNHSYCGGLRVRLKQRDETRLHVDLQAK